MKHVKLYDDGVLSWHVFGRDFSKPERIIDTNEYVIISDGEAMMLDPGGVEIFPTVLTSVSHILQVDQIKQYLCSHQDPDIMSSLPLWMGLTPNAKIYLSWLWDGFVAHFGNEYADSFVLVPDEGQTVQLGCSNLQLVPAHHCHSSGNFHLFDPKSGILFSGDVGAALLPDDSEMFVKDFDKHVKYMEGFHRRWMPSNDAKNAWVQRVRKLNVKMICPQHGAIFAGENVGRFLDWFEEFEVGKLRRAA
jgi:flavorubredoxin